MPIEPYLIEERNDERTSNKRRNHLPVGRMDAYIIPNVHKHITMAQRHECKFAEVGVRGEVLKGVQLYGLHVRLLWFA